MAPAAHPSKPSLDGTWLATRNVPLGTVYRRSTDTLPRPLAGPNVTVAKATIADIAWLVGEWTANAMGNVVEQRWLDASGGAMLGSSRRMQGASMLECEFLCIA